MNMYMIVCVHARFFNYECYI